MSFFKSQVSFPLNFATLFNVMTQNSSEIVLLKHYMIWTKRTHQCTIFRFLGALMKVHPIPHVIFETTRASKIIYLAIIWHHCSVSFKITPLYFFSSNLIIWTKTAHQSEVFEFLSNWVKIHPISQVIFETTSQFFFKFCITLQCHEKYVFFTFLPEILYDFYKRSVRRCKMFDQSKVIVHQICTLIGSFFESM